MWLLVWIYLAPYETLDAQIPHAAVKETVMGSRGNCETALDSQLRVNDTSYLISRGTAQLFCIQVPSDQIPANWPPVWRQ